MPNTLRVLTKKGTNEEFPDLADNTIYFPEEVGKNSYLIEDVWYGMMHFEVQL